MAYQKTIWKNREVEKPRTFTMQNNPDGTITLKPAEGQIIEAGTPIIAVNMNNMENGIEAAHDLIDTHKADNVKHITSAERTTWNGKIDKSLATAANDFLVASGAGAWVKKTLAEVKTLLGLKSAAYTESSAYATAAQGTKADNALPKAGGALAGAVVAHTGTDYSTKRVRNIYAGTADLTPGSSALDSGAIYVMYE